MSENEEAPSTALDRIALADWPALEVFARVREESVEEAASDFEEQFLGEWPNLTAFCKDRLVWEYDVSERILPFVDVDRYYDFIFFETEAFFSIGHADGIYVFQLEPEPIFAEASVPLVETIGPE